MTLFTMQSLVLWGLVATTAMATILQASQGLGLSRMSLTFLLGSAFSGNRSWATIVGFTLYMLVVGCSPLRTFCSSAASDYTRGGLGPSLGLVHGTFILVCAIPLLPYIHPRMASSMLDLDTCAKHAAVHYLRKQSDERRLIARSFIAKKPGGSS